MSSLQIPFSLGAIFEGRTTRGIWRLEEQNHHINVLGLKAILFRLKSLVDQNNCHVKILTDNMTAVYCIRNMGSCQSMKPDRLRRKNLNYIIEFTSLTKGAF